MNTQICWWPYRFPSSSTWVTFICGPLQDARNQWKPVGSFATTGLSATHGDAPEFPSDGPPGVGSGLGAIRAPVSCAIFSTSFARFQDWRHEFQEWFEDRGCCWRVWKRSSLSPFRQASSGSQRMQALVLWVWSASFNGHFRLEALYCMMRQLCRLWRWCQRRSRPYIYLLWPWPTVARGNDSRTHVQSARNHEKPRG